MTKRFAPPLVAALIMTCQSVAAQPPAEIEPINPKADHVERWNWFARAVYALHAQLTAGRTLRTAERIGGYARERDFYKEISYFDQDTGRLISRVQWESAHPDRIHSIEVFVHDQTGRLIRDYGAWFLTHSRTAPQATVINLHAYNKDLVAFRQFDATDKRIYESCKGRFKGRPVTIQLWEDDIIRLSGEPKTIMTTPAYAACFRGLPKKSAGKYLTPQ